MPLRAFINDEEIISIDQTAEQWSEIKKSLKSAQCSLILPCCNQEGFLRTSSKGLNHFVHAKSDNTCDWKPESPEHLKAKIEIIEACKENGWTGIPEFSEKDWRADVLAIQNNKKIAFEVQWTKQTFEETKFRQERYKESNVRGCWFFRAVPREFLYFGETLAKKEIPAFKISKDENSNIIAELGQQKLPLKSLVDILLKRKLRFCEHMSIKPKQEVTIIFFGKTCWKCKKSQHCWTVQKNLNTVCNQDYPIMSSMWAGDDIDTHPKIYEAIQQFIKTPNGEHLKIGQLRTRYNSEARKSYRSHVCYYCDSIFGDFYLSSEKTEGQYNQTSIKYTVEVELGTIKEEAPHWCYSEDGNFCE